MAAAAVAITEKATQKEKGKLCLSQQLLSLARQITFCTATEKKYKNSKTFSCRRHLFGESHFGGLFAVGFKLIIAESKNLWDFSYKRNDIAWEIKCSKSPRGTWIREKSNKIKELENALKKLSERPECRKELGSDCASARDWIIKRGSLQRLLCVCSSASLSAYFLFRANALVYSFCLRHTYARAQTHKQTYVCVGSFTHRADGAVDYSFLCTPHLLSRFAQTLFPCA